MIKPERLGRICILIIAAAVIHAAAAADDTVVYNNIRFNTKGLDFAAGVTPQSLKASPLKPDEPPGSEWPAHTEFKFPHYFDGKVGTMLKPDYGEPPLLAVYPTVDFASFKWDGELKRLKALLKKRPGGNGALSAAKTLPFLPTADAAQVLHADAVYLPFRNGTGIRYITHYAQDVSPYTAESFFYTFQGLTGDGKTYIAATFPLYTPLFPRETPKNFDYKTFDKQEARYRADGVRKLNAADLNRDFTPSISQLDRLISSLEIGSAAKPAGRHP